SLICKGARIMSWNRNTLLRPQPSPRHPFRVWPTLETLESRLVPSAGGGTCDAPNARARADWHEALLNPAYVKPTHAVAPDGTLDTGRTASTPSFDVVGATNPVDAWPPAKPPSGPTQPNPPALRICTIGVDTIDLVWTATTNDSYQIERSLDGVN